MGHTHRALNRHVGVWHVLNLGSVSNPPPGEHRASYVLLRADDVGYQVEQCLVEYDRAAVITALEQLAHPGARFIIKHLRGRPS